MGVGDGGEFVGVEDGRGLVGEVGDDVVIGVEEGVGVWECGSVADAVAAGVAVPVGVGVVEADIARAEFGVRIAVANS